MKSLYQIILEQRAVVGSLPFTREEFKKYCPDSWDDDNEFVKDIDNRILQKYGSKVLNTFRGWIEGSYYGTDLDVLYDVLCNVPLTRLDRVLGAGSNGIVVDCGDRIIKWFHKNTPMKDEDNSFFEWCMKHPKSKVFPVVYKLGKNYVVMEKLKTGTPRCKLYDSYLGFGGKKIEVNGKADTLDHWIYKNDPAVEQEIKKDREAWEVYQWGKTALQYLKESAGFDKFSDLRLANIGERKNGEIVWFDI